MSRESLLILLGLLVAVLPFLGLPLFWLSIGYPVIGALVVLIGLTLARRKKRATVPIHETSSPQAES
jgi:cell division protein FtsW (lipid II flippase)